MSVLLLNFTYEPLGVLDIARAVRLLFARKVEVLHRGEREIRTTSAAFPLPSVVRMLYYVHRSRKRVALTKKNVLLRDDDRCAYCALPGGRDMTVDHVVPRSRGGRSAWENLVACCPGCNARKRDRTPEEARMPLRRAPREPRFIPWIVVRRNTAPDEWARYLTLYSVGIEERVGTLASSPIACSAASASACGSCARTAVSRSSCSRSGRVSAGRPSPTSRRAVKTSACGNCAHLPPR